MNSATVLEDRLAVCVFLLDDPVVAVQIFPTVPFSENPLLLDPHPLREVLPSLTLKTR